jgi:hypothetical protein
LLNRTRNTLSRYETYPVNHSLIADGKIGGIGTNYHKAFRSQNRDFTNRQLCGFEISADATGILSDDSEK